MKLEWLFFPFFGSTVGSGTRWKLSAVCGSGVCHSWHGWGGTATHWWQAAGRDTHQGVLLCPWPSWKKHVGCSDCCSNHGTWLSLTSICMSSNPFDISLYWSPVSWPLPPRLWTGEKVSSLIPQLCRYLQASTTLPPSRCCSTRCHRQTNKVTNSHLLKIYIL